MTHLMADDENSDDMDFYDITEEKSSLKYGNESTRQGPTKTSELYDQLVENKNYVLTSNPKYYDDAEEDAKQDEALAFDAQVDNANFKMKRGITQMMNFSRAGDLTGRAETLEEVYAEEQSKKALGADTERVLNDTKDRWYIVSQYNAYKVAWDWFVIFCTILVGFTVPIEIAFARVNDIFDSVLVLHAIDVGVDVIFIIDIAVAFMTSYVNTSSGDTVTNPKKIAWRYMMSGLAFDFLSAVPFLLTPIGTVGWVSTMTMEQIGILRIFKLVRLRKIDIGISNMTSDKQTKTQLKRVYIIFLLLCLMHVQACAIYLVLN